MANHKHIILHTLACFGLLVAAHASEALDSTRNIVKEWVATEKAISSEAVQWEEKQTLLNDLIGVTQAEINTLTKSLATIEATQTEADAVRAELVTEQEDLNKGRQRIATFLDQIEPKLRTLRTTLPTPLEAKLAPLYQRIPQDPATTSLGIAERMQTVIGLLSTINKFDRVITVHEELRTLGDGSTGEVETVYIGLGAAYYRTRSGDDAGIAQPSANGWQWQSQPELSASIAEVIAIANNQTQEARFIALPVEFQN